MNIDDKSFKYLSNLVISTMGIKMPPEKRQLMETRLTKRLHFLHLNSFKEYCDYLKTGDMNAKKELVAFYNCISTNKTDFFREIAHFHYISEQILPSYHKEGKKELKIWSAASSSGEELYTIAMTIEEYMLKHHCKFDYTILGTDISTKVLQTAKEAVYSDANINTIPDSGMVKKYFDLTDKINGEYTVKPFIRKNIKLGTFNLMSRKYDLPGEFDIVFCRNVLIYFEKEKQQFIINNILHKLVVNGFLFLGHSESMAGMHFDITSCAPAVFRKQ